MEKYKLEDFIRFLKERNAYYQFIRNIQFKSNWLDTNFYRSKINILSFAFTWIHTKEGRTFWEKINVEWRRKIKAM